MTGLVRAELLKVRSTRMWLGLFGGALLFVALNVVAISLAAGSQPGTPTLDDPATVRSVWAGAAAGTIFALVLGILSMTTEYRHMTVTSTFLAEPRRPRVVAAKLAANAIVGLALGLVSVVLATALAVPLLAFRNAATIPTSTIVSVLAASLLGCAVYAMVGVGVGALVRNQIAAIVGALVWTMLVEGLVVSFLPAVGKWLPGGAATAMLQATSVTRGDLLAPWAGTLLFLAYGLVFAGLAAALTVRRDIT